VTGLVVSWDGDINEFSRRVSVTEGDNGNVNVGCFTDCLGVGAGVGDNDETRLLKRASDIVGEVTGSETTSDSNSSGVRSKLEDSTLTVRTGRDDTNISRVIDGGDDAGCEDNFLPLE
jgi:hypothetical protein